MLDFEPDQRTLLFGLAATFVLAAMGAAVFHVRWHAGSGPTELMGWMSLIAVAVVSLTQLTLDAYGKLDPKKRVQVFIGVAAGGTIMALVPFSLIEYAIRADPTISQFTTFNVLFGMIITGSFVLATALYAVIENEFKTE